MEIGLRKLEVFSEVEKQSSLIGSSLDGNDFENLWATEYEGHFLDSFWIEGTAAAVLLFKRYIKADTVTHDLTTYDKDEVLTINAVMPERFSEHLKGSIIDSLKMMIASNILYRWLLAKSPELSERYKADADDYVKDLIQKLTYRKEPAERILNVAEEDLPADGDAEDGEFFRRNIHDYIKFNQYEGCNDCPQPRRNNG